MLEVYSKGNAMSRRTDFVAIVKLYKSRPGRMGFACDAGSH